MLLRGGKKRMFLKVFATLAYSFIEIAVVQSVRQFSFGGRDPDVPDLGVKLNGIRSRR